MMVSGRYGAAGSSPVDLFELGKVAARDNVLFTLASDDVLQDHCRLIADANHLELLVTPFPVLGKIDVRSTVYLCHRNFPLVFPRYFGSLI